MISDQLRQLLSVLASEDIRMLCKNPYTWFNMNASLQNTSRRALTALSDSANAEISFFVDSVSSLGVPPYNNEQDQTRQSLLGKLSQYYLYVLCITNYEGISHR